MAGTLTISTLSDGTNSTSSTNCIRGSAKAWVQWTGSSTINSSYNVSSITRNGTGDYTVTFTSAMSDTGYCALASGGAGYVDVRVAYYNYAYATGSFRIQCTNNATGVDASVMNVSVFR